MNSRPSDQEARERFTGDWSVNLAVVANAGSGKTTAISERLAAMALSPDGGPMLARTAVVTYTKKAAAQINRGARAALLRRMGEGAGVGADALGRLDRVFFGTIHSFCLVIARRHGSTLGIHLNPTVVDADDDLHWQEFLEEDPMTFASLSAAQVDAFLRHTSLDDIFDIAKEMDRATAAQLRADVPPPGPPGAAPGVLDEIDAAVSAKKGKGAEALARNKVAAREWWRRFSEGSDPMPIAEPEGKAANIGELYRRLFAPLKDWLARAGGVLAAELSLRYRAWRLDRGIQTYADQVETALEILETPSMLEALRAEGWRVILDEAQDTDPKQFAVLVEITRPPGSVRGTWPKGGGAGPRPGHFCMVGDAQQGIYSSRADIINFKEHVDAFKAGNGGRELVFSVTFRAPKSVVSLLNATLPEAFGPRRPYNFGVPPKEGAPEPMLQVDYVNLVAAPASIDGAVWRLPITPGSGKQPVDARLSDEARQLAAFLAEHGPASVGAASWGDICIVAPRKDWLDLVRDQLSVAKVKTALQMRRNRNGDNPVYAWVCGILAVVCDPDNTFEWVGVLRELFSISDAVIAGALAGRGFRWQEPGDYPRPIADAVGVLTPLIDLADVEEGSLVDFALRLSAACGLREKARAADPDGGLEDELTRILAGACEIAMTGGGPRAWLRSLLGAIDEYRPSGRPSSDAINLTTSHSAKGLEWPVVIPVGLGRPIMTKREGGLRIVAERGGGSRVAYDPASVPAEARDSLERARLRELVRLLYVTLTRPKTTLVIPWSGAKAEKNSFAEIWAFDAGSLPAVPEGDPAPEPVPAGAGAGLPEAENGAPPVPASVRPFPRRILPHGLAAAPDPARAALHESSVDLPQVVKAAPDPLEYGIWWHETLEFMPWDGDVAAIEAHGNASLARAAQQGFAERAGEEWTRLLGSDSLRTIREARWTRLAEAGIFAPLAPDGWIDGVIDLVLHDAGAREVWIIDWKTNRRGAGEDDPALLGRLCAEYRGQLSAYGACASGFFPGCRVRLWVYSSVAGTWSATEGLS